MHVDLDFSRPTSAHIPFFPTANISIQKGLPTLLDCEACQPVDVPEVEVVEVQGDGSAAHL